MIAALLGIPVGLVWIANLPYAPIRRPIAQTAPILLLPSYISIDRNYRDALQHLQQAEQLITQATTPADLDLGERQLQQAQENLDRLPIWFLNDFPEYRHWGYGWSFQSAGFNAARGRVGNLQAKVFQEKNAQTALLASEQAIATAKQQYQQATTAVDQQVALTQWRTALNQLQLIPGQTLAGKTAQPKLVAYQTEFDQLTGQLIGSQRASSVIEAAKGFASRASQASQNPPHTVEEWMMVEQLWQEAIDALRQVPSDDLQGYGAAQAKLAEYTSNLEQIKVRRQAEAEAVRAYQQAQTETAQLQALADRLNPNEIVSRLQRIINQLERVEDGTTVYLDAQNLLLQANNKLNQVQ
ncbi:MAG: hypothetical protein HC881_02710 [Leptolyngbyaceae cyanobacterium SL_7_1]|nr:hypothetical protein [Leptolyngbyaceae cyanobacterium SL_7_1]